jgi:hypothetical protein
VEYEIPHADEEGIETHSAATTELVDEEVEVEHDASLLQAMSRMPSPAPMTEEHATASTGSGDETEEVVDIYGATTPPIIDDFWETHHPNSPLTTPLT